MIYQANSNIQFSKILDQLNVVVPPRGKQRTTEHCETWTLHSALSILHNHNVICFPISIEKYEKPDYWIEMSGKTYGAELTEIIHSDYARVQTLPEAQNEKSVLDPSLFKWGQASRSTKELRQIAAKEKLTGTPWVGDCVEREFAQSIADTVSAKRDKLITHYKRADIDVLLIYHNQSSPALDYIQGLEYTKQKLVGCWDQSFQVVAVIKYEQLFLFTKSSAIALK
ncbi:hypothetical protein CTM76_00690 [Photobacterium phosphoreum]|jgi:hypothetical protein|uniref:hypothetical protein n=1 Tax=Photobacterium phosphoreum TaxID=659 RepID=UPI0007F8CEF5|nr:hypothetical protein [Photobacterium phosphoreum]OBU35958.1 hypothetical protein AYY25_05605 [Photobacterium phosphoreum]PSU79826.1 hypothetical protein CTM76_00690 [Photobacterium phosphoreum]